MKIEVSQKTTTNAGTIANCLSRLVSFIFGFAVVMAGIGLILMAGMKIQEDITSGTDSGRVFVPLTIALGYLVIRAGEKVDS